MKDILKDFNEEFVEILTEAIKEEWLKK